MKPLTSLLLAGAVCCSLGASTALAQFSFDLGKIQKGIETTKDVAKMAKGVAGIGPEEERTIGGSVAIEIVSRYGGLVRDEMVVRRLNLIGKGLARYSERPELNWRFGLLDSAEVNAFSAPAGYVFITRGLYELCNDDDQLAAVLAHEISHITRRHALKIVARGEFLSGATNLAARQSSDVRAANHVLQEFDLGINQIVKVLFEKGFDPETEYEADKCGDALCTLGGYKKGSLRAALTSVKDSNVEKEHIFSTHPTLRDRIKRLPQ